MPMASLAGFRTVARWSPWLIGVLLAWALAPASAQASPADPGGSGTSPQGGTTTTPPTRSLPGRLEVDLNGVSLPPAPRCKPCKPGWKKSTIGCRCTKSS